jgi:signal transduction histidine kinase
MSAPQPRRPPSRLFYVAGILVVSLSILALAWLFRGATVSLLLLTGAWVLMVVAFAWDIATRAARLDEAVHSRTDALERTNAYLSRLLEQLQAFRHVSYDINQRIELEEIVAEFTSSVERLFPEVDSAWLWLDRRLLRSDEGGADGDRLSPLDLAAQAGPDLGHPDELLRLERNNPLVERCFHDLSVAVEDELVDMAAECGWQWLAQSGMASFAAFRLELGQTVLGVFGIFSRKTISADFARQLHLSANQLAVALEKGRLLKAVRGRAEELAAAYDELQKLDAMKDWFVSAVSHELRTPLTSIRSFSEILERYEDLTGQERLEFAGIIREESERLSLMIDDVLDLNRIVQGQLDLTAMPFDLVPLVGRAFKLFWRQAHERGMDLRQDLPEQAWVSADESAIARVFNNLIGNAFKFTPDGGTIEVAVRSRRDAVEVSVRDSGVGIAPADHERIFERFTQLNNQLTGKPAGSGIGLAICKELVEASSGSIWVESELAKGSTFRFTLPAASEESADKPQAPLPEAVAED